MSLIYFAYIAKTSIGGTCLVVIPNPQPFYQEGIGDANQQFVIKFVLTSSSSRLLWAASDAMLCFQYI